MDADLAHAVAAADAAELGCLNGAFHASTVAHRSIACPVAQTIPRALPGIGHGFYEVQSFSSLIVQKFEGPD